MTTNLSKFLSQEELEWIKREFVDDPDSRKTYIQVKSLDLWERNNKRGTIELATGVGKTRVGILAAHGQWKANPNSIIYIIVPTETLRDTDWPNEFRSMGLEELLNHVTILCHQSLSKHRPKGDIDLLIWDEFHHITPLTAAFFNPQNSWKVYDVMGLTATLPKGNRSEEDQEKLSIINAVAPSVFKVPLEQAIDLGLVADFDIKVLRLSLDMVDKYIEAGSKKSPFKTTELAQYTFLTKCIQKAAWRNFTGLKFKYIGLRTRFLLNLRSRVRVAVDVLNHIIIPEKRTLIFCGGIDQANDLCGNNVYHSKSGSTALNAFLNKEINYLGVCQALNEGKNIPELDQMLAVCFSSSDRAMIQRIGRTIRFRPGHKGLVVIITVADTADEEWLSIALEDFDKSRIEFIDIKVPENDLERKYAIPVSA